MTRAPARLLLSGYFGFGNFGDEAILDVFVQQWRKRRPADDIIVLSAAPDETARTFNVKAIDRFHWSKLREAIGAADVVVSGGGGLLQTATSLRSLLYYAGVIREARRAGRKTAIFAQGIGPLNFAGKQVVKRTCGEVGLACVRDEASAALLQSVLPGVDVRVCADPVFMASNEADASAEARLSAEGLSGLQGELVAVVVRRAAMLGDAIKNIGSAIDRLAHRYGAQAVFVPFQSPDDADAAVSVIRKCSSAPVLLGGGHDLRTMTALFGRCAAVLSMRLHALILAAKLGVPFVAVPYDPKIQALLTMLAYPMKTLDRNADPQEVVDQLWARRFELRQHLERRVPPLASRAALAFDWLEELVDRPPLSPA